MKTPMMKNKPFLMIAFAITLSSLLLSSCNKDDDKGPSNYFSISDSKTEIKNAVFFFDATAGTSPVDGKPYYRHELALLSDGFTVSSSDVTGKGTIIDLLINGSTVNLDAGTYLFTGKEDNPVALEFWEGTVYENITIGSSGGQTSDFTAGKVVISKSGTTYTIELDGTAGGKTIKGLFTGTITSIEQD